MSDKKCVAHYQDVVVQNYNKYRTLLYYIIKQYKLIYIYKLKSGFIKRQSPFSFKYTNNAPH